MSDAAGGMARRWAAMGGNGFGQRESAEGLSCFREQWGDTDPRVGFEDRIITAFYYRSDNAMVMEGWARGLGRKEGHRADAGGG